jgi:hypothetical protein
MEGAPGRGEVSRTFGAAGLAVVAPLPGGHYRVVVTVDDAPPAPDLALVQRLLDERTPGQARVTELVWSSRFRVHHRVADHYRAGRLFLAGDAAHVHSPAGGQGMNTGIQDAANLGWKLAAAVQGWGGEDLLDSYDRERHPIGRAVLRSSGLLLRLTLVRSRAARAARTAVVRSLLRIPAVNDRAAATISGIGVRYSAPAGADRQVGTRAADVPLRDGGRLHAALRGGRFVLLGPAAPTVELPPQVDAAVPARPDPTPDRLVLVRPDGYVGWAGTVGAFPAFADTYFWARAGSAAGARG